MIFEHFLFALYLNVLYIIKVNLISMGAYL